MEGALKQVQKLIDGGMKTKEAIKRVAQEMNGSKNELYDAYHKHIWSCESRIFFWDGKMQFWIYFGELKNSSQVWLSYCNLSRSFAFSELKFRNFWENLPEIAALYLRFLAYFI